MREIKWTLWKLFSNRVFNMQKRTFSEGWNRLVFDEILDRYDPEKNVISTSKYSELRYLSIIF